MDGLRQGFAFLPVLIGLFAFSQLLSDVETKEEAQSSLIEAKARHVKIEHWNAIKTILRQPVNLIRSSLIGVFIGALPAAGGSISNILSYDQAKKASKYPEKFGTGVPDGIIASEAANNGTAGGDIITAVMLGALLIHNIVPSPTFITERPESDLFLHAAHLALFRHLRRHLTDLSLLAAPPRDELDPVVPGGERRRALPPVLDQPRPPSS